jgi:hypothetical protein
MAKDHRTAQVPREKRPDARKSRRPGRSALEAPKRARQAIASASVGGSHTTYQWDGAEACELMMAKMTRDDQSICRLCCGPLIAFVVTMVLAGCGSSNGASATRTVTSTHTSTSETPAARAALRAARAAPVIAACRRAVRGVPRIPSSAASELDNICTTFNEIPEDDERLARAACSEAVIASPLSVASAKTRAYAACYAEATKHLVFSH